MFATNSVISLGKLFAFARNDHFSLLVVPQAILSIRFLVNIFMLVVWSIDPLFLGRYFSNPTSQVLFSAVTPFHIVATLIQAFYWHVRIEFIYLFSSQSLTLLIIENSPRQAGHHESVDPKAQNPHYLCGFNSHYCRSHRYHSARIRRICHGWQCC